MWKRAIIDAAIVSDLFVQIQLWLSKLAKNAISRIAISPACPDLLKVEVKPLVDLHEYAYSIPRP